MTTSSTSLESLLSLKGKTVLITGAAQGIGRAIAERYAEAGADLQLLDVSEDILDKSAKEIRTMHDVKVSAYAVDLGNEEVLAEFWDQLSPVPDVLVNNAGIFWPKKLEKIDTAAYDKIMNINTRAVITNCRELVERRGGRPATIVNIASIEAVKGMTYDMMLYGASKAAVLAVSRAIVKDYGKDGWKCNTILPGGVSTPGGTAMAKAALKSLDFSIVATSVKFALRMPTKGIGKPDDIARAALWLGTPVSDFMNGAEVVVDGGFLAV